MMDRAPLHMLMLPLDGRRLASFAHLHGLSADLEQEGGYVVHALLAALFGSAAPKPWSLQAKAGGTILLAYSARPLSDLRTLAEAISTPDAHAAIDWTAAADKRMPTTFSEGTVLGFEVRACPVVRLARGAMAKQPGSEVDVFLASLDKGADGARADLYIDWLAARIPGAALGQVRLKALRLVRLHRRGLAGGEGKRPMRALQRPDALFTGHLSITDSALFADALARGIGRHRAFGFGMLLLKPGQL